MIRLPPWTGCPDGVLIPSGLDAVVVDVHGEASSEKMALGHVADGTASLVVGTPRSTADAHVFPAARPIRPTRACAGTTIGNRNGKTGAD